MKKALNYLRITGATLFALFPLVMLSPSVSAATKTTTSTASEQIKEGLCAGANLDLKSNCDTAGVDNGEAAEKLNKVIRSIINILSLVIGAVAVFMIIIGGFKYITSGGSSDSVTGAKNTILYAIIGLIVVSLAQLLTRFIIGKTLVLGA